MYLSIHYVILPLGQNAKGILDHPSCTRESVVKETLLPGHVALRIRLHKPLSQRECIIRDDHEWHWLCCVW